MGGKLGWLNWFWQFLCKGLSSFKLNGFYHSYTWSCGSWEGRTYPFAQDLSLEKSADSYVYFKMTLLYVESYFFSLSQSPSLPLCLASDAISCNIDEVLSISPSANVFVFAWYEEVPPIIEGSKAPPPPTFQCLNIILYRRFEPLFWRQASPHPTLNGHPYFLYFFQIPCVWQDFSDNIFLMK